MAYPLIRSHRISARVAVMGSVFPFSRFAGVDAVLGPEMKSTGEVMGLDGVFGMAFAKSQLAAGQKLPVRCNGFSCRIPSPSARRVFTESPSGVFGRGAKHRQRRTGPEGPPGRGYPRSMGQGVPGRPASSRAPGRKP